MDPRSGYLFVYKPPGITSSDLVLTLKRKLKTKAIGHTGTLDRFAEGLLILPICDYTSFSQVFLGLDKTYYAEVLVGKRTDSGDPDGVVEIDSVEESLEIFQSKFTIQELEQELRNLEKITQQSAPKISALKVGGKRQSDLVRMGVEVEEKIRSIRIYSVSSVAKEEFGFSFRVHVSSGTYIRKMILDLSGQWGIPLTLQRLVRERIANYDLSFATHLDSVDLSQVKSWKEILPLPYRKVEPSEKKGILHGGYVWDKLPNASDLGFYLVDEDGETLLAWCTRKGKPDHLPYRYRKVFFDPHQKIMFSK